MARICGLFIVSVLLFLKCGAQVRPEVRVKITGIVTSEKGVDHSLAGTYINLVSYKMGEGYFNSKIDSNGNFGFTISITHPDLYELKYGGYKLETLLCPTEQEFKVEIKTDSGKVKTMKVVGSHEFDAYREFKYIDNAFREKLRGLIAGCATKEKECTRQLKKESEEFNASLEYLQQAYKGTFAADVLAPMDEMPEINTSKPAIEQLREHFFDHAKLDDINTYITPDFSYNLSEYIDDIADTTAGGRMSFINVLNNKAKGNKPAQKELIDLFVSNFMDANRENYLWSLAKWASGYVSLPQEQPALSMRLQTLEKAVPGMPASEVSGTDINGQALSLSSAIKKQKLTLLIFWASDCPHCRASMPEIEKIYSQYHNKGLGIFAVSLEANKEKWKEFITEKQLAWTNVLLPLHDFSPNDYFLQFTPTLALINQNGIIIHRFMSIPEFSRAIGEILEK